MHPVELEHVRDAIAAGVAPVQRELGELRADVRGLRADVDRVCVKLDARPVQRWLAGRVTAVIDKALPLALIAAATYLLTHQLP